MLISYLSSYASAKQLNDRYCFYYLDFYIIFTYLITQYAPKDEHSLCILIVNLEILFNFLDEFEQEEKSSRNVRKLMFHLM